MKMPTDKEPKSIDFYTVEDLEHAIRTQPADRKRVFQDELERRANLGDDKSEVDRRTP
jgi:hypothetical protein